MRPVGRTKNGRTVLFREVCAYDTAEDLPIGDRIATMTLSLMNDENTAKRVDTVRWGIDMAKRYFSDTIHPPR